MKELKAPDKVTQKMTHDGAVTENLATGEVTNISSREAEVDLSASEESTATAEAVVERAAHAHDRRKAKQAARADAETVRAGSEARGRPSSRLQFTDEELAAPDLQKAIRRSDRAADKLDAAKGAIPTRKVLKTERVFDEAAGRGKTRLRFEEVEKKPNGHLRHNPISRPVQELKATVHGEVRKVEHKQYTLTQTVTVEVRYRTETRTDSEGNEYDVEVPYNYYICNVTLENFDLSHLPVYMMNEDQLSLYAAYMSTLGNRPDLFGGGEYPGASTLQEPTYYDIPPEALEDEAFAAMIAEAEKYLGYPYVWGGSSPSTSFDCSGFVSWVINHSGWSVGRLGAQGLYNICTPVSSARAKPGDLIFFKGTYDTPGVSHVGIYVGGGMMIHCGSPISYTSINTNYWQAHYFSFGRLP